jgi:hypothetical protein
VTVRPVVFHRTERILSSQRFSVFSLPPDAPGRRLFSPVIKRGKGPYLYDHDGNRFVDLDMLDGSVLHGHANPRMTSVMKGWAGRGYGAGLPAAAHDVPARAVMEVLYSGDAVHERDRYAVLFTDSAASAALAVSWILRMRGVKKVYAARESLLAGHGGIAEGEGDPVGSFLRGGDAPSTALIPPLSRRVGGDAEARALEKLDRERGLLVLDELSVHSHLAAERTGPLVRRADMRVLGPWIAGGISFGCLVIGRDICASLWEDRDAGEAAETFRRLFFPPTWQLKTALRSLGLLREAGGVSALRRRYTWFKDLLGTAHLRQAELFAYAEEPAKGSSDRMRVALLEKGVLIPPTTCRPLSVSFAHDDDLLKRSAELLRSTLV